MRDRILWETQFFAPTYYPIELVSGECFWFFDKEQKQRIGFYAKAGNGWRSNPSDSIGGSPLQPTSIPRGVQLVWFSLRENKFYHTVFVFSKELLQTEFNKQLHTEFSGIKSYQNIQFAISPGGFIAVRLGWAHTKEIRNKQAMVADIPWDFFAAANHFSPNSLTQDKYRHNRLKDIPAQYANIETLPTERWMNYSTQLFPWKIESNIQIYAYSEYLINGNHQFVVLNNHIVTEKEQLKAVPVFYRIYFKEYEKLYCAYIQLSKNSPNKIEYPDGDVNIFEAFIQFFKSSNHSAILFIKKQGNKFIVSLRNDYLEKNIPIQEQYIEDVTQKDYSWFNR